MAGLARLERVSVAVLVILSIAAPGTFAGAPEGRLPPWRVERDIRRFRTVATDNVMRLLAIRPGMTILDVGAGTGQFAYEFARRLNGTGRVDATDTNGSCVDYMTAESARRGLGNLHPVLVAKEGIDAFYRSKRYDLITVFHVLMPYERRVDYFRELRGSLADGGRLVLILYKVPTPFSPGDFTRDFQGFLRELSLEPAHSPYYGILRESTRRLIREQPAAGPSGDAGRAIADDFNEVLSDTRFASRFAGGSRGLAEAHLLPDERAYADWVLVPPPDAGIRVPVPAPQRAPIDGRYSTINKLLIVGRYRRYLKEDGLFRSGFTGPVKAAFEEAGYRLEREYGDVIPFEDLAVLSAN